MKRPLSRLICLILCILLTCGCLFTTSFAANDDITLTAVNDSFLPLSSSTMPVRRGGAQYVPYSVFSGTLGISGSYNSSDQVLTLSNGETSLRFDLSRGTVYDQNMNSYTTPAYWINSTIYVPVKLVCGKFNLTYSNIPAAAPILRICNSSASLSDSSFVSSSTNTIRSMLDAYNGQSSGSSGSSRPSGSDSDAIPTPIDPTTGQPTDTPVMKPNAVYLAYVGAPGKNTEAILDALDAAGMKAAFFVPADGTALDEDLLRQIVGRGHTVGFTLISSALTMPEKLRVANDTLFHATGTVSHLVCISDGSEHLSATQQQELLDSGYRLWDASLDSRDHSYGPAAAAQTVTTALSQTTAPAVIRMGQYTATARTTELVCAYLSTYSIPVQTITFTRSPVNNIT